MFRLPLSVIRGVPQQRPFDRTIRVMTGVGTSARGWQPQAPPLRRELIPREKTRAISVGASTPKVVRREHRDSAEGRHYAVTGKVLAMFVTIVLGRREGYERYLKQEVMRLRSSGMGWARMSTRELRDIVRSRLARIMNVSYLQNERTTLFVRPSYRGNPVKLYRDASGREFAFIISRSRPSVIGVFTLKRFLATERQRLSRRHGIEKQEREHRRHASDELN